MATKSHQTKWGQFPAGPIAINKASPQAKGLIGFWPILTSDSYRYKDRSSNTLNTTNDLVTLGAPKRITGPLGNALLLASGQYLQTTTGNFSGNSATFSIRVKLSSTGVNREFFERDTDASSWGIAGSITTGNVVQFSIVNQVPAQLNLVGTRALLAGQWYTITCTYNIATNYAAIYINGILDNSTTLSATSLRGSGTKFTVGANDTGGNSFAGAICDVRYYNIALSPNIVQDIHQNPTGIFSNPSGLGISSIPGALYTQSATATATSTGSMSSITGHVYTQSALATPTSTATATLVKQATGCIIVFPGTYGTGSNNTRYSANGISWSYGATLPGSTGLNWEPIGEVNGYMLAQVQGATTFAYTTTPATGTYTSSTLPIAAGVGGAQLSGVMYITSGSSYAYTSNGTSWTSGTLPNSSGGFIASSGSLLVSTSLSGTASSYSSNGTSWTAGGTLPSIPARMCWNGTVFAALTGTGITTSTNGVTWGSLVNPTSGYFGIAANRTSGTMVTVAGNPTSTCYYSTNNGVSWSSATLPQSAVWRDVAYDEVDQLFITWDYSSSVTATSPDGITWTARTGISDGNQNWIMYARRIWTSSTAYTQSANALATSTANFASSLVKKLLALATPGSTALKTSNPNLTKTVTSTSTATKASSPSLTKSATPTSTSVKINQAQVIKTATPVISTASRLAQLVKLFSTYATATTTSTIQKAIAVVKSASATSTATYSRIASYLRTVIATSTSSAVASLYDTVKRVTASAFSTSTATYSRIASYLRTITATPTSTAYNLKVPAIQRTAQPASTATITKALNKLWTTIVTSTAYGSIGSLALHYYQTCSATATSIAVAIKKMITSKTATPISNAYVLKVPAILRTAQPTSTSTLQKAINVTKSALVTSVLTFQKAIAITRSWVSATTGKFGDAEAMIHTAFVTSIASMQKIVYSTKATTATSITRFGELIELTFKAVANTTSAIFKASSVTKIAAYVISYGFIKKSTLLTRIAVATSTGLKSANVYFTKLTTAISTATYSAYDTMKYVMAVTLSSTTSHIQKALSVTKSATAISTSAITKLVGKIVASLVTTTASKIQLFDLIKTATSTTVSSVQKAIAVTKEVTSTVIAHLLTFYHPLITTLVSFFVSIADTLIYRQEVKVTESTTVNLTQATLNTVVRLPGIEHTVIRL